MEYQNISVKKVATHIGAEVSNVDLTQPITAEIFNELNHALCENQVIFFRDQNITPQHHRDFAERFGKTQSHPAYPTVDGFPELTILENDENNPSKIEKWHIDMTFMKRPPLGSILHGKSVPPVGGDTVWSSMYAAYEALSDHMQSFLSGLTAIHDFAFGFKESLAEPGGRERLKQAILDNPPVEHPVIRTHPETGRKAIFVNCLFTREIKGMKHEESESLLNFLYHHAVKEEFACRFKWQNNSIAFWDNRCTQHKPVNDYYPQYRKMQRITVAGDVPV